MLNYTEAYGTVMLDDNQVHRLTGSVDGHSFTEKDVKGPTWSGIASNQNVLIGSAAISKLQITFLKPFLSQSNWEDKVITIYDGTMIGLDENEEPIWEDKLIGTFYIGEAVWTNIGTIEVTAYDVLSKLDEDINYEQAVGTVYDFLNLIGTTLNVPVGMTREEAEALPNGTEIISPNENNDMTTYRDLLAKVAQFCGGFGYAKRDGSIAIKAFNNTSLISIPINRRMKDAKYSDYQTRFDYLSYSDVEEGEVRYIGDQYGYGMDIGTNPFLQYGTLETKTQRAETIFSVVHGMTYTPFTVQLLPSFCVLELGDVVTFLDDYTGNDSSGSIMSMTWTYGKYVKIQCYGANPNLKKGKSSTDVAVTSLSKSQKTGFFQYYSFVNAREFNLGSTPETIIRIRFTAQESTTVELWHELKMLTDALGGDQNLTLEYYLDGEKITYEPSETYDEDGYHTFGTNWLLDGVTSGGHTWEVKASVDSGTAHINVGDIHAVLKGQRLAEDDRFDGNIELSDTLEPVVFARSIIGLSESVEIDTQRPIGTSLSDEMQVVQFNRHIVSLSDSMNLTREKEEFYLVTENEDNLATEDDDLLIT